MFCTQTFDVVFRVYFRGPGEHFFRKFGTQL